MYWPRENLKSAYEVKCSIDFPLLTSDAHGEIEQAFNPVDAAEYAQNVGVRAGASFASYKIV